MPYAMQLRKVYAGYEKTLSERDKLVRCPEKIGITGFEEEVKA